MTPIQKWGKDHWSLLAYVECRCVDNKGELDRRHMRCNEKNHPLLSHGLLSPQKGDYAYPTRLKNAEIIAGHDDWDVLDDLEKAGFIDIFSMVNACVKMTVKGNKIAAKLRAHKTEGKNYAEFVIK